MTDPCMISPNSESEAYDSTSSNSNNVFEGKGRERPDISSEISAISKRHRLDGKCVDTKQKSHGGWESNLMNTSILGNSKELQPKAYTRSSQHQRGASLGSSFPYAWPRRGRFSISDFKLGKVLGSGGTATVITAELICPLSTNSSINLPPTSEKRLTCTISKINGSICVNEMRARRKLQRHESYDNVKTEKGVKDLKTNADVLFKSQLKCESEYALKVISKKALTKRAMHYLIREVTIHRAVQTHQNIVSLFDVFEDKSSVYLLEELVRGGDLFTALKMHGGGISELCALRIVEQILEALSFMHRYGFVHRDIKPENIMFSKRPKFSDPSGSAVTEVKLIDFGLSCARDPNSPIEKRTSSEKCGTLRYAAPEVVAEGCYIPELADIWSVGVVFYSTIANRNPYSGKTERKVLEEIERCENGKPSFNSKEWEDVSKHAKTIIEHMLRRKPTERPSAEIALSMVQNAIKRQLNLDDLNEERRKSNTDSEPRNENDVPNPDDGRYLQKNDRDSTFQSRTGTGHHLFNNILSFFNGHVS